MTDDVKPRRAYRAVARAEQVAAKRREIPEDVQLLRAMDLLRRARTTQDLLALAPTVPVARRPE